MTERKYTTVEARTAAFFEQDVDVIAQQLIGMTIQSPDGFRAVQVDKTSAFPRKENEKGSYKTMFELKPGTLYACPHRGYTLSLVVAKDTQSGQTGACVKLENVAFVDDDGNAVDTIVVNGETFNGQKTTHIARYFELEQNHAYQLQFVDLESNTLQLKTLGHVESGAGDSRYNPDEVLSNIAFG